MIRLITAWVLIGALSGCASSEVQSAGALVTADGVTRSSPSGISSSSFLAVDRAGGQLAGPAGMGGGDFEPVENVRKSALYGNSLILVSGEIWKIDKSKIWGPTGEEGGRRGHPRPAPTE